MWMGGIANVRTRTYRTPNQIEQIGVEGQVTDGNFNM